MQNYYEAKLLELLKDELLNDSIGAEPDDAYIDALAAHYPFLGSKIDWRAVPGWVEGTESRREFEIDSWIAFFDMIVKEHHLDGCTVYVADAFTSMALLAHISVLRMHLQSILTMPHHHYILAKDYAWCMCFSMEGHMDFGFRPEPHFRACDHRPEHPKRD